jgi:hypothetical protein
MPGFKLTRYISGLWMTVFYPIGVEPPASFDGPFLYAIRLLVGIAMAWFMFPSIQGELARTICMGAGWCINLALAQWLISRKHL